MSSKNTSPSRGRPRGFNEQAALEQAMLTFWRGGYANTSLDDLVQATGASRASIYSVFGDKRALFRQCLALYGARFSERIAEALDTPVTGRERLERVLNASADRLASPEAPPGCLRCNSTLELMGTADQDMQEVLQEANDAFLANLRRLVDRAVEAGEVVPDQAGRLALYFTCIVNGMVTLARSGASREELAQVIAAALSSWPSSQTDS